MPAPERVPAPERPAPGAEPAAGEGAAPVEPARRPAFVEDPELGRVTPETEQMLDQHPHLRRALEDNPQASRALKLCRSFCFPENATAEQVARLERVLADMEAARINVQTDMKLREYLYARRGDLDGAIEGLANQLETHLDAVAAGEGRAVPRATS